MKLDIIDVFKDACTSLFGRIVLVVVVVNVFGSLGLMTRFGELGDLWECFVIALPAMLLTILGGIGLITLPLLLAFTIFYAQYELHYAYLSITAVISFYTLYKPLL
jgi:hypothetical protein